MDDATRTSVRMGPRLLSITCRVLSSTAEAEWVVQDAYSRWRGMALGTLDEIAACLITVITRRCLDRHREPNRERRAFSPSRRVELLVMR
jgi:DNA-directed RNA polymerase specialized sigma24 family protein